MASSRLDAFARANACRFACAWLLLACDGATLGTGRGAPEADGADPLPDGPQVLVDGGDAPPLRVAVVSDLNSSYGSTTYEPTVVSGVSALLARAPDVVLSTGDMVAGQKAGLNYGAMWAAFHATVSDPIAAAGVPFAVTPGNHDASGYATFAGERAEFVAQWTPRKPNVSFVDDADYPLRYAFTLGDALFVSLDDTTVGPLSTGQMTWLEGVLTANASSPVKIVYGHVPLYPYTAEKADEIIGDPALEALLASHDVTAFITGHHHAFYPGRREDLRMVGMACLGAGARRVLGTDTASANSFLLLEVAAAGITSLEAYAAPGFDAPVARATLPASIGSGGQVITRDDL